MRFWFATWAIVAVAAAFATVLYVENPARGRRARGSRRHRPVRDRPRRPRPAAPASPSRPFGLLPESGRPLVRLAFTHPPKAGILFDVDTGQVLWRRNPARSLPIASLTKMMTALIVAADDRPEESVLVTRQAVHYQGSGIGVLPKGREVPLRALFAGLLLVSGNDAAIALAQHDAGSVRAFVDRMNRWGNRLGLRCSRFSSPSGIRDAGNYSCPYDLAQLARADLANALVAHVVGERHARFRFPIKGHYLDLWNINPFIANRTPGITGLKTGYTTAAGRCYVVTRRIEGRELGVVLLHSPNPLHQVPALLRAGAKAEGQRAPG